ncbi:response regulator [Shewanella sp. SR43-4]|jgi:two-component system nitrate/nitrite response regulator NarP|uniref:Response regulator n=1 Tax=Shewanella vesiculosa TaxID=518738 RepID=A0ABV0FV92_9GAMM|nr:MULTISPECIES: response regulator [Shewanella]NCQ45473.1 response regulator [Shewanella frigidimarina]MBB1316080.1 response regulator [Shewanella sp. SR43-4]MBB1320831.1 response regulator [Shewanella sp. SR43-8]MBB1387968.1 response regulator [Shewanella sp. SG44-6]MBB1475223.1 response regulator [Shewanella sp. SG41-3]|tara:strand:- start:1677 stop:2306 length:630 start_codon:yes stop_codon:yes gene_type:complete
MGKPYSVLVVDDHPLLRRGICQLITSDSDFSLFGETGTGLEALTAVAENEPDIILLDLNMKGMSGLDTLNAMRQEGVTARIVILTVSDAKQDVTRLLRAGADGYLLKDTEPDLLLEQLKNAMLGHRVISNEVEAYLYELESAIDDNSWVETLTPRELQILQQLAEGKSNRMIAEDLHISEGTVKVHVKNLLRKANAKSRTEMAVRYLNN